MKGEITTHTHTVNSRLLFLVVVWSFACEEWNVHLEEALAAWATGLACWPWFPTYCWGMDSEPLATEFRVLHWGERSGWLSLSFYPCRKNKTSQDNSLTRITFCSYLTVALTAFQEGFKNPAKILHVTFQTQWRPASAHSFTWPSSFSKGSCSIRLTCSARLLHLPPVYPVWITGCHFHI